MRLLALMFLLVAVASGPVQSKLTSLFSDCQACAVELDTAKAEHEKAPNDGDDMHVAFFGQMTLAPVLQEIPVHVPSVDGGPLSGSPLRLFRPPRA